MGKMFFTNNRFVFVSEGANESRQAQKAGFIREGHTLQWATRRIEKAVALREFADESAEIKFKKHFITEFKRPECIPYPDHLDPKVFQIEGAWHLTTRSPAYLADQPGLGKTIQAALAINAVEGRTYVVCPPFLKYNWKVELEKWLIDVPYNHEGVVIYGEHKDPAQLFNARVVIVPDTQLQNIFVRKLLEKKKALWLFVDEAHRFKEEATKRTKALIQFTNLAKRVVLMSGTPILNRPMELYPLLSEIAPEAIHHRTKAAYGEDFCNPKKIKIHRGPRLQPLIRFDYSGMGTKRQMQNLKEELFEKLMLRRLKRDVLKELPEKMRQIIFVDQPKSFQAFEKGLLENHTIEQLLKLGDEESFNLGDIAEYRRQCGFNLIVPATEIITDILESTNEALIVAAHHVYVVASLAKYLRRFRPLTISGGMTAKQKQLRVKAFQSNPAHRLIIGNIDAMGVGFTLTRARRGLVVEPSWTPGVNEQLEDRIHRMTQKREVLWQYLIQRGSINERILYKNFEKQEGIDIVMS